MFSTARLLCAFSASVVLAACGGGNGTIALHRSYGSTDGINWGTPVATGDLRTLVH